MKHLHFLVALLILTLAASRSFAQHRLTQLWATDSVLNMPESALPSEANHVIYVSNIGGNPEGKEGKGSIGQVGFDGSIINQAWVGGLNAPKGMALVKNMLWVADVDELAVIDIRAGKVVKKISIPGAQFLNDVTADDKGVIYVSDSKTNTIYKVEHDRPQVYVSGLKGANGVLALKGQLYFLDNGGLYARGADGKPVRIAEGMDHATDGLEHVAGSDFLATSWFGIIYYVKGDGTLETLLDTREQKSNTADIGFDPKKKIVYVPTFYRNRIVAYQLQ